MYDVGAHHYFRLKVVKEQQHHHDDATRSYRSNSHKKSRNQPEEPHPRKRLHGGRPHRGPVFNLLLKKQKGWYADQKHANRNGDEMIDSVTVMITEINQKIYADVGTRGATRCKGQHNFSPNRTSAQVNCAGANLGDEIKQRVGADGSERGNAQTKNQDGEQQNAAPDSRHSNESPYTKTHQAL